MKSQLIKVEKGHTAEVYIKRNQKIVRHYSSEHFSESEGPDGQPSVPAHNVSHHSGMRANLTLHGPCSIAIVTRKNKK
jgi:hypothetical protein